MKKLQPCPPYRSARQTSEIPHKGEGLLLRSGHSKRKMSEYKTDIDIAREVAGEHINDIGAKLKIDQSDLVPIGHDKAKISWDAIEGAQKNKDGKLILVTAVTPTPAGEVRSGRRERRWSWGRR